MNDIVLLYGSYAKGESTEMSDVDVLVINNDEYVSNQIKSLIESEVKNLEKLDLKHMTHEHFMKLVSINSLFVHHLIESGIFLKGREEFDKFTKSISRYSIQQNEVLNLIGLAEDCLSSICTNGVNIFDLSILFTFLRNGIILINYKYGTLEFSKLKLLAKYKEQSKKFPDIENTYLLCYDAKLKYNRNLKGEPILNKWKNKNKNDIILFIEIFREEFLNGH